MNGQLASLIQRRAGGGHRDVSTQRTRSRGGARRPATTPPPVGAGRRAAGTSIERHHGNTSGFCAFCRLCFRAAARSMPRAARPPAGDACHFSPRDSAPQRPLREIVSALSAIFASDDKVIYVSLLSACDRPGAFSRSRIRLSGAPRQPSVMMWSATMPSSRRAPSSPSGKFSSSNAREHFHTHRGSLQNLRIVFMIQPRNQHDVIARDSSDAWPASAS